MFDASSAVGTDSPLHTCSIACTHTLPSTWGLVFPAPVTFNEEERGVEGQGTVCVFVREFEALTLQTYRILMSLKSHQRPLSCS